ncbi:MAG: tetratricopeptide repeat-containing sensor histidine kinase, partial [Bacteroidota bacterium]
NNLNNMGVVYDRTEQFDSARIVYQKAHEIKKSLGNEASLAISYFNLGSLAISMNNFEEARQYIDSSMNICEKLGIEPGFAYNYSGLGELYLKQKKYHRAVEYLKKGIAKAKKFNLNDVLQENLYNISVVYYEMGKYKEAYENQRRHYHIRDSIRTESAEQTINVLQTRFDSELKENKILQQQMALKEKEVAIQQSKLEKERLSFFLGVGLIILVFVLIFSLRTRRHLKKVKEQANTINRKNEQLAELTEFRNSMISTMVHDLKTPLNTIIGFSDLPPDKENLQYIHQIGYSMLHLVSNILDVQYQKEAKLQLHLQGLLPQTVLDEALPEVKTEMQMKEQDIVVSLPEVRVLADYHLLKRIFVNLLTNAVKFSPEKGQISLQGEILPDKAMLKINVRDQGGGIDPEIIDKVFDQFTQSKQAKFGMSYSSGIGLYFCKMAVEEMGGEIGLTNEEAGLNAWFLLPLAEEAENPPLNQ